MASIFQVPEQLYPGADYRITIPRITGKQIITLGGTGLGGTFTLYYKSNSPSTTTLPIAYNATAAAVKSALEVLPGLGSATITVTGSAGGPWTISSNRPVDPNVFVTPPLGYNIALLTGSSPSLAVALEVQNCTGFTYDLQARSHAPLPTTANIHLTGTLTSQGQITNHGATGLIDILILGTYIETLNFTYIDVPGGETNTAAPFNLIENDGTNQNLIVSGVYQLNPRVHQ